jgi:ribosomal protein S18 acetylase RimI-like enzyme
MRDPGAKSGSPRIDIRPAVAADNHLLSELGRRTFSDSFAAENTPENMRTYLEASFSPQIQAAELADPDSLFLIAEVEGETAGYARLHTGTAPSFLNARQPIELARIYADRPWIGRSVGPALMAACLQEAARRGCDLVWLGVWQHNPRAIAFYRKWGFEIAGTQRFQLGDDLQTDWVMRREV